MTTTYVRKVEVVGVTQVKKITIGTPIRKVTGAAAQSIGDLTDVDVSGVVLGKHILQWNSATAMWEPTLTPTGLTLTGGQF